MSNHEGALMGTKKRVLVGLAAISTMAVGVVPATSATATAPVSTIAGGFTSPAGVDYQYGKVYVADGGTGKIVSVDPNTGKKTTELTGLTSPSDVARVDRKLVVTTAGVEPEEGQTELPEGGSSVFQAEPGQTPKLLADLLDYELKYNPDGQQQFGPNNQVLDALSNPFAIIRDKRPGGYVLVADAGANAVLAINPQGKVSNFFVPPLVTTGFCAGAPNNDTDHVGCDSVPTDLTYGTDGYLYVSTLSSLVPGEGRVYVLDAWTGAVKRVITGLTAPTGVVTDNQGNVYTSEVTFNAPGEGAPPKGFNPASIGRVVKTAKNGTQTQAAVTMPIGLAINSYNNELYSTAWSLGQMFLGLPDAGQLVKVQQSAFQ
jgi:hypothetical protein